MDWSALFHAHGPAVDVPRMLHELCSSAPLVRDGACSDLFETVWHQGTIYPASSEILPFLLQVVDHRNQFTPDWVEGQYIPPSDEIAVALICSIATGVGWLQHSLATAGEGATKARLEAQGRDYFQEAELEALALKTIKRDVLSVEDLLKTYLDRPEALGDLVQDSLLEINASTI